MGSITNDPRVSFWTVYHHTLRSLKCKTQIIKQNKGEKSSQKSRLCSNKKLYTKANEFFTKIHSVIIRIPTAFSVRCYARHISYNATQWSIRQPSLSDATHDTFLTMLHNEANKQNGRPTPCNDSFRRLSTESEELTDLSWVDFLTKHCEDRWNVLVHKALAWCIQSPR